MNRNEVAGLIVTRMGWNPGVVDGCVAVMVGENSNARCNPWDDERVVPGSTPYNPQGVQNYPDVPSMLDAYALTLAANYYAAVRIAGASGSSDQFVDAWARGPWGTWTDPNKAAATLAMVRAAPAYGETEVAGTGTDQEECMSVTIGFNGTYHTFSVGSDGVLRGRKQEEGGATWGFDQLPDGSNALMSGLIPNQTPGWWVDETNKSLHLAALRADNVMGQVWTVDGAAWSGPEWPG